MLKHFISIASKKRQQALYLAIIFISVVILIFCIRDYINKTNKINEVKNVAANEAFTENSLANISFHKELVSEKTPQDINTVSRSDVPKLNLHLSGIIMSTNPQKSHVIIGESDTQRTYGVNDSIDGFNGVSVRDINDNKVIIDNNGSQEEIEFFPTDESKDIDQADETTDFIGVFHTLSDFITINTVYNEHEIIGLRLNPKSGTQGFINTGLKPGDIAIQWNNHSLTKADDIKIVQDELKDQQSAQVTVRRNKETFLINLKTADMDITKESNTK